LIGKPRRQRESVIRKRIIRPSFIALGAAEDAPCQRIYHDKDIFGGVTASSYRFD
jgi:hypothetical protein